MLNLGHMEIICNRLQLYYENDCKKIIKKNYWQISRGGKCFLNEGSQSFKYELLEESISVIYFGQ